MCTSRTSPYLPRQGIGIVGSRRGDRFGRNLSGTAGIDFMLVSKIDSHLWDELFTSRNHGGQVWENFFRRHL